MAFSDNIFTGRDPGDVLDPEGRVVTPEMRARMGFPGAMPPVTPVAPTIASSPAHPDVPQSSTLDQIMATNRAAIDAARSRVAGLESGPPKVEPDKWTKIASIIAAGAEGWQHNPSAGLRTAQGILSQPQMEARQKWEDQYKGAQRGYEDAIQNFNVDLSTHREQATEADRAEARKIQTGNLEREKTRDTQTQQWHEEEVKRQQARDTATEKHWSDEIQMRRKELSERLQASKDAREGVGVLRAYVTEETSRLNELDRRIAGIDSNIMSKNDPSVQQERKDLLAERAAAIQELNDVKGLMKKHLGIDHDAPATAPIAQFEGAQQFTVSAPGKPAVQKSLTYQQVQQLQQAGVNLAPVQDKGNPQVKAALTRPKPPQP
jgi:hypothetical protein